MHPPSERDTARPLRDSGRVDIVSTEPHGKTVVHRIEQDVIGVTCHQVEKELPLLLATLVRVRGIVIGEVGQDFDLSREVVTLRGSNRAI